MSASTSCACCIPGWEIRNTGPVRCSSKWWTPAGWAGKAGKDFIHIHKDEPGANPGQELRGRRFGGSPVPSHDHCLGTSSTGGDSVQHSDYGYYVFAATAGVLSGWVDIK